MPLSADLRDTFAEDDAGNEFDLSDVLEAALVVMRRIGPSLGGDVNVPALISVIEAVSRARQDQPVIEEGLAWS